MAAHREERVNNAMRSPICTVMGHVDHGKSSILDKIRGTAIVKSEAGAITQAIGASIIPLDTIKSVCGPLLEKSGLKISIPGLLFIDTPGHAAFTSLRRRGGSLADIAILVVDLKEGFMPQTKEAIEILRQCKTPFLIAANKLDLINGYKVCHKPLNECFLAQAPHVQNEIETRVYELVNTLYDQYKMEADRFDRINDFTKKIVIVPCSAKTGEGIPELLMFMAGLAQKFLESSLKVDAKGYAKGTILEVKEEQGMGKTLDVIIYDGHLKKNDTIVIGTLDKSPIVTKIRALLEPKPLQEMRDRKAAYNQVQAVYAATGVKISAPNIENAQAGMPIVSCSEEGLEEAKEAVQKEIDEVMIELDDDGIIIKADTLGSLEALSKILRERGIKVRKADIGTISKKDCTEAKCALETNPLNCVILGFNVDVDPTMISDIAPGKVFTNTVIYRLIEDYQLWLAEQNKRLEKDKLAFMHRPVKIQLLKTYIFRRANPVVMGVEVELGMLQSGQRLMKKNGKQLTCVKTIQKEKESVPSAKKGEQVACSLEDVALGRQLAEDDVLYSFLSETEFRKLKDAKEFLTTDEIDCLKEIAEIMREENPVWGI